MNGLTDEDVLNKRRKYGSNEIITSKKDSFIKKFIQTLGDPIIKILLIALAVKTLFLFQDFDWYETVGIVIAIFLASFISTISECGSEKAFEAMQEEASRIKTKVKRSGKIKEIDDCHALSRKNDIVLVIIPMAEASQLLTNLHIL